MDMGLTFATNVQDTLRTPSKGMTVRDPTSRNLIRRHAKLSIKTFGGVRAAARVLEIDPSYLSRLARGEKDNPSNNLCRKLGLRRVTYIEEL